MGPVPIGTRVKIVGNNEYNGLIGHVYQVYETRPDGCLVKHKDDRIGGWSWSELSEAPTKYQLISETS